MIKELQEYIIYSEIEEKLGYKIARFFGQLETLFKKKKYLLQYNDQKYLFVSYDELSEILKCSRKTIQRRIKILEEAGILNNSRSLMGNTKSCIRINYDFLSK